jgi:hypothetical protein
MPPIHKFRGADIFVEILHNLRCADTEVMLDIVKDTFCNIARKRPDLFSDDTALFAVLDEAQAAANLLVDCFPSTTNTSTLHPVLHDLYRFLCERKLFVGFIVSGTGLSTGIVKSSLSSIAGKAMTSSRGTIVFTGAGVFSDKSEQEAYIKRYLTLSEDVVSDRRLLERMKRWFIGRCVLDLGLLDLFLTFRIVIDLQLVSLNSICTLKMPHVTAFSAHLLRI